MIGKQLKENIYSSWFFNCAS